MNYNLYLNLILFAGAIGAVWNAPSTTRCGPFGLGCRTHFTGFITGIYVYVYFYIIYLK